MFGQLLQKERSISLPKAEIFTCRKFRGDLTPPQVLRMSTGFIVGHPSEEPRYHEGLGWAQAPHGSRRTWDTEGAHFLLYHVHLFSNNSQTKSFLLGLKSENDWSYVELKAPRKMGF